MRNFEGLRLNCTKVCCGVCAPVCATDEVGSGCLSCPDCRLPVIVNSKSCIDMCTFHSAIKAEYVHIVGLLSETELGWDFNSDWGFLAVSVCCVSSCG